MEIIGIIRPFDLEQSFYVYDNNELIDTVYPTINEVNETIFNLSKKYNLNEILLHGEKQYVNKLIDKFYLEQTSKYNNQNITVKII